MDRYREKKKNKKAGEYQKQPVRGSWRLKKEVIFVVRQEVFAFAVLH